MGLEYFQGGELNYVLCKAGIFRQLPLHVLKRLGVPLHLHYRANGRNAMNLFHFLIHNFVYRSSVTIYSLLLDKMQGGYE